MLHTIALQNHTHPRLAAFSQNERRFFATARQGPDWDDSPASIPARCADRQTPQGGIPRARGAATSRPFLRGAECGESSPWRRHNRDGTGSPAGSSCSGAKGRQQRHHRPEEFPGTRPPRASSQRAGGTQQHPPSLEAAAPLGLPPAAPPGPAPLPSRAGSAPAEPRTHPFMVRPRPAQRPHWLRAGPGGAGATSASPCSAWAAQSPPDSDLEPDPDLDPDPAPAPHGPPPAPPRDPSPHATRAPPPRPP